MASKTGHTSGFHTFRPWIRVQTPKSNVRIDWESMDVCIRRRWLFSSLCILFFYFSKVFLVCRMVRQSALSTPSHTHRAGVRCCLIEIDRISVQFRI